MGDVTPARVRKPDDYQRALHEDFLPRPLDRCTCTWEEDGPKVFSNDCPLHGHHA